MIELRLINQVDPKELSTLANNPALAKNLRDSFPHPYTNSDALAFIQSASDGLMGHVFGIFANNTFVGCCSVIPKYDVHRLNVEIGYWIGEPFWGRGFATQATGQLLNFAFDKLKVVRVFAGVFEYNIASMRVLEKLGFKKEAILEQSIIKSGKLFDEHIYSIRNI